MLLAGDVGATKTRLAIYDDKPIPQAEKAYTSDKFEGLEDLVAAFLKETGAKVSRAVFGLPGPVIGGVVRVTNLPWVVSQTAMQAALGIKQITLLNDLEATAYGIPFLPENDLHRLNEAQPDPSGNKVVIAPGTGLGEAILFHHNGHYYASPSEGGHTDFAPRNVFEMRFLRYLMGKYGHVSYERICSGIGIPHIYDYLRKNSYKKGNPAVAKAIKKAADRVPVIITAALKHECELCEETLQIFVSILGSEAGNMALKLLARGGVYLGGGIPPKILPALEDGTFMTAFVDKGRFTEMLTKMPVYVILNEKTALFGAACYGLEM